MPVASVEGSVSIRARPSTFVAAFVHRLQEGLLPGSARVRVDYVVTRRDADRLAFRARSWWTAIAVGLNDVDLAVDPHGRLRYRVQYARWAASTVALSAGIGLVLAAVFFLIDIRAYVAGHQFSRIPGLSLEQNVAVAWGMVLFWSFVWPWVLVALYRRPLRRLTEQIVAEVDAAARQEVP